MSTSILTRSATVLGAVALSAAAALPAHAGVLFDNGSPSTGAVATNGTVAPDGTTWAESQGGTIGWTNTATASGFRYTLADDFTVTAGTTWTISSINLLSYVTDVPADNSPIRGVAVQIWLGTPGAAGSTVVWGNLTTNLMSDSTFANIYRNELNYSEPDRPLWNTTATTTGLVLGEGSYWVEWLTITGSTSTRAYGVPVHVDGMTAAPGANGLQGSYNASTGLTTYTQVIDTGVQQVQDIPFILNGTVAAVPEPATAALWLLGVVGLAAVARRRGNAAA